MNKICFWITAAIRQLHMHTVPFNNDGNEISDLLRVGPVRLLYAQQ